MPTRDLRQNYNVRQFLNGKDETLKIYELIEKIKKIDFILILRKDDLRRPMIDPFRALKTPICHMP